jgi:hypothetical protein
MAEHSTPAKRHELYRRDFDVLVTNYERCRRSTRRITALTGASASCGCWTRHRSC